MASNASNRHPMAAVLMTILALLSVILAPTLALASAVPQGWGSHGRTPTSIAVSPTTHPIRMSFTKVQVDGGTLRVRVRAFWDDLQLGIAEHTSDLEYRLAETAESDALVETYLNEMIQIDVREERLQGRIEGRGVEAGNGPLETMWWFELVYDAGAPPSSLKIRHRLLFNLFEDQRNIVHVVHPASGKEHAFYYSWDEEEFEIELGGD